MVVFELQKALWDLSNRKNRCYAWSCHSNLHNLNENSSHHQQNLQTFLQNASNNKYGCVLSGLLQKLLTTDFHRCRKIQTFPNLPLAWTAVYCIPDLYLNSKHFEEYKLPQQQVSMQIWTICQTGRWRWLMNESSADSDQKVYEEFQLPTNSTSPTSSSPRLLHNFLDTQAAFAPKNLLQTNYPPAMGVVTFWELLHFGWGWIKELDSSSYKPSTQISNLWEEQIDHYRGWRSENIIWFLKSWPLVYFR